MGSNDLRNIPKVDELLTLPSLSDIPRPLAKWIINQVLEIVRKSKRVNVEEIKEKIEDTAKDFRHPYVRRAVNGLGVVLHTGLGRAPLSHTADLLSDAMNGFTTLQIDFETGRRGDRYQRVDELLRIITGCESSIVVNNNAAATMLILNTFAKGREVIVSRGQLVEIGGAFRIPDVMEQSGARLVEVGTTNRTHLKDYAQAIGPETAALMRVHQSNYRIIGFTKEVSIEQLVELGHKHELIVIDDLGSGCFVDLRKYDLPYEPTVQESIKAGTDLICFSGDKLLSGSQCGIILGRKDLIDQIKKNQLTRALRCCKLTFAVLEATLKLFLDPDDLFHSHPVFRIMARNPKEIKKQANRFLRKLRKKFKDKIDISLVETQSEIGGGSLAGYDLPSYAIAITPPNQPMEFARNLRRQPVPIMGRVEDNRYLLDFRTIQPGEEKFIEQALENTLA